MQYYYRERSSKSGWPCRAVLATNYLSVDQQKEKMLYTLPSTDQFCHLFSFLRTTGLHQLVGVSTGPGHTLFHFDAQNNQA